MKKHLIILLVISVFTTASAQNYTQAFDSVFRHVQKRIIASVNSLTASINSAKSSRGGLDSARDGLGWKGICEKSGEEIVDCVFEKCIFASKTSEQKPRL